MTRWMSVVALSVTLCACDGAAEKPDRAASAAAAKAPTPAKPESAEPEVVAEPLASEPPPVAPTAVGAARIDPPWFRATMLGAGATMVDSARSEADEAGLFKSHMVFELPEGTSTQACGDMITKAIGESVEMKTESQSDGRLKITGATERFEVTSMCGEAKGTMRAYVAYAWTS